MYRHATKHYTETMKSSCKYCRKMPALWHYVGSEKICIHCGTRVYHSAALVSKDSGDNRAFEAQ